MARGPSEPKSRSKNAAAFSFVQVDDRGVQEAGNSRQHGPNGEVWVPRPHWKGAPASKAHEGHAFDFLARSPDGAFSITGIRRELGTEQRSSLQEISKCRVSNNQQNLNIIRAASELIYRWLGNRFGNHHGYAHRDEGLLLGRRK